MKIAILGSTGYLGKRLSCRLMHEGHEVLCLKKQKDIISENDDNYALNYFNLENIDDLNESFDCLINLCCRYQKKGINDFDIFLLTLIHLLIY